ncbi:acyltransferase family protein [Commensalibacter oyaizuii]|uniref:Acyltransferase n=1 Tax=Commensalibacter oyaizuii TaxID=3043873 RepID=A0ABT6PZ89_9PROT|nr:acyltransferase [Commensalibacter sp. TBRC 16381]MDI2090129.1 acyltransferase [Commensalibacter sp. TBRC 16381]
MKKQTLNTIQALRGIAALFVCSIHCITTKMRTDGNLHSFTTELSRIVISIGSCGVDIFFVISGYIITLLVLKTNERSFKNAFFFLIKRFFRIYPLFWITLSINICVALVIGYQADKLQKKININVILLLTRNIPFQEVAWTLAFEIYFYLGVFLFLCVFNKKHFLYFLLCWGIFLFCFLYLHFIGIRTIEYFILKDPKVLEFFLGGLLFFLSKKRIAIYDKYLGVLLGLTLFTIGSVLSYKNFAQHFYLDYWQSLYLNGFGAALLLYGFIGLEYRKKIYVPMFFIKLGNISYSIYLWHFPVMGMSGYIALKLHSYQQLSGLLHSLIEIVSTIFISIISYRVIELPCIRFSQRITS